MQQQATGDDGDTEHAATQHVLVRNLHAIAVAAPFRQALKQAEEYHRIQIRYALEKLLEIRRSTGIPYQMLIFVPHAGILRNRSSSGSESEQQQQQQQQLKPYIRILQSICESEIPAPRDQLRVGSAYAAVGKTVASAHVRAFEQGKM